MAHLEGRRRVVRPAAPGARTTGERRTPPTLAADLGHPRASGIRRAVGRLDAALADAERAELVAWLREEYATAHGGVPLGFLARCHLGPPYADHTLSLTGGIVHHYAPAERMPEPFARARMLVRGGAYAWVEVFDDGQLLPVHGDGAVVMARPGHGGRAG